MLPDVDRIARNIGKLAGRQYGHVTRGQLLAAGLSSATIGRWTARGRLIRVHAGVYAVGHARAEPVARAAAALLACGDRAVLSHETAAALWGFRSRWPLMPEDQVAAELRDRGFPEPLINASVLGFEVGFLFPDHKVIVELDGWLYHSDHPTWESDRTRDTMTAAAGFVTLRITWLRWQEDRAGVVSDLAAVLAGRLTASAIGHPL